MINLGLGLVKRIRLNTCLRRCLAIRAVGGTVPPPPTERIVHPALLDSTDGARCRGRERLAAGGRWLYEGWPPVGVGARHCGGSGWLQFIFQVIIYAIITPCQPRKNRGRPLIAFAAWSAAPPWDRPPSANTGKSARRGKNEPLGGAADHMPPLPRTPQTFPVLPGSVRQVLPASGTGNAGGLPLFFLETVSIIHSSGGLQFGQHPPQ